MIQKCGRRIEFQHSFVKDSIEYVLHVNSTYAPGAEAVFDIQKNNIVLAWVLSRNKTLSSNLLEEAHQTLMKIPSTSLAYFNSVSHSEKFCDHMWSAHVHAHYHETDNDSLAET
ncbi:unnamed protein product [Danaus chrysippus]|uniref:(African queen) hypothetical protein n=1 Tax=Danaus chrysippus TaxID=151541 RepID=A0A8J2VSB4_9NEOP|nr:unnamed protein product [Danaus chrysippus]